MQEAHGGKYIFQYKTQLQVAERRWKAHGDGRPSPGQYGARGSTRVECRGSGYSLEIMGNCSMLSVCHRKYHNIAPRHPIFTLFTNFTFNVAFPQISQNKHGSKCEIDFRQMHFLSRCV
jgi:hypothetical protein